MKAMDQETKGVLAANDAERRRHTRYRLVEGLLIRRNDGSSYQATTSEISISGLSAFTTGILRVGEEVRLCPVAGMQVSAIIRRSLGTMYGFEFSVMPPTLEEEIHKLCRGLVPFRTAADK
jgi:hypothetical protein